ncbi:tripeptidyl aminopeptidase [Aspergillus udagawae]|uniref:Tripeptidyl aminopeptidase n=1 Tax=Aspergillus udagawae TaxID=91492 RepID=A0A8H3P0P0_9EURO|nr:tripeptidyl aminopeptidase [Aspergillus udagawae]
MDTSSLHTVKGNSDAPMVLEKQNGSSRPSPPNPGRRNKARPIAVALMGLVVFLWLMLPDRLHQSTAKKEKNTLPPAFSWEQITPSKSLEYHDCFDGFQCARLEVDYHREDGQGRQMAIGIARLPAKVPVTDSRYGGAVLINPGGPGGSGVGQALLSGRDMQMIVDAEADPALPTKTAYSSARYFDIIGFDPRGVNNTTPGFSCFPNSFSQRNWELQVEADGMLGSSDDSLMRSWQRAISLGAACSQALQSAPAGTDEALGEHLNTPTVARDMLEIIERHGEWRERQGQVEQREYDRTHGYDLQQRIVTRTKWKRGHEKLLYWGRSYGTVLGSTFAMMFPDRIERLLLDAVVDVDKYYTGEGPDSIVDADAIFDRFAFYCDASGLDGCPFYRQGGPAAIKAAYLELEAALHNASVPAAPSAMRGPEVVTWTDLKSVLRFSVYQPLLGFPLLAHYAKSLAEGDGSPMADFKQQSRSPSCPSNQCVQTGPWSDECLEKGANELYAMSAILCSDAPYLRNMDQARFQGAWASQKALSFTMGDYWAAITALGCVGHKSRPKWQLTGPYTGNTSHPILLVSNTLDPVTPAKKMSQSFPGSVVLQQDSEGHTTLAAPSLCVSKAIRAYFQSGVLPDPGTVCAADLKPLLGESGSVHAMNAPDRAMYDALMNMAAQANQLSRRLPFT